MPSKTRKNLSKVRISKGRKTKDNRKSVKRSSKRVYKLKRGGSTPEAGNAQARGSFMPIKAHSWFSGESNVVVPPESDPTLQALLPQTVLDRRFEKAVSETIKSNESELKVKDVKINDKEFSFSNDLKPSEVKKI